MTLGRSAKNGSGNNATVMPHAEFMNRIRKSLYFGGAAMDEKMEMSRPLAEYASELFSAPHKGHSLNRLNMADAGSVKASPCSLIMALIYLDRLNLTDPGYVRRITPQELFIVSMMISTKFYAGYDEGFYLLDWAADGDMTESRLKRLELEFLCAIDWNVYISNEEFFGKLSGVEKTLARREGLRRGWLTYSELMQMLPSFTLAKFILSNITVMAVSYAASVMTIAGAFFLASQIPGNALHRKTLTTALGDSAGTGSNGTVPLEVDYPADSLLAAAGSSGGIDTVSADAHPHRTNQSASTVITIHPSRNANCSALNVEAELLKLERQYREEALRDEVRRRNHEIDSASRLTLPDAVQHLSGSSKVHAGERVVLAKRDVQRDWFALKEEYADNMHQQQHQYSQRKQQAPLPDFVDCVWNLSNCTTSVFWQLFSEGTQQTFVRLPLMWFKFM